MSNSNIASYYDNNQALYTMLWNPDALHYGLWYPETQDRIEALENANRLVAERLMAHEDGYYLDAGCGVGGTCRHLAREYNAQVQGITLSERQIAIANERTRIARLDEQIEYSQRDFTNTEFGDSTFNGVYGIESICHAEKKADFLTEAHRVLQPGGRVVVMDAFLKEDTIPPHLQTPYNKFLGGWGLPNLATRDGFMRDLGETGFDNITYEDLTPCVQRSSKEICNLARCAYPITWALSKLHMIPRNMHGNSQACYHQKTILDGELVEYGIFSATKQG